MTGIRVRFAPSPTGQLHVGNVRTALFNLLFARGRGGTAILRIEDTDVERSTPASERAILGDLDWLGLQFDEGPHVGGAYGPYRQSERIAIYTAAAEALTSRGHAYFCFCTPDELEADRTAALEAGQPPKYSGRCRLLDVSESRRRVDQGTPAALRFRVPDARIVTFPDLIRGDVAVSSAVMGDFVIMRSSGVPAYNFAVVVDDAAMQVTHVVRGEDHISNTPRQLLVYEALGHQAPVFAHLPMVLGPDQARLSKRHGATSVDEFRARGYLPEALVNYLALLGWSPGDNEEIVPLATMAERFRVEDVSHSAAVFDTGKLAWMNRHYMKVADPRRLAREAWPYLVRAGHAPAATRRPGPHALPYLESVLPMAVGSVDRLDEIPDRLSFLFAWRAETAATLVRAEPGGVDVVTVFAEIAAAAGALDREAFRTVASEVRARTGAKGRALFHPLRVALTAEDSGPELDLAVPAIDRGAALPEGSGLRPIVSCRDRAARVADLVRTT